MENQFDKRWNARNVFDRCVHFAGELKVAGDALSEIFSFLFDFENFSLCLPFHPFRIDSPSPNWILHLCPPGGRSWLAPMISLIVLDVVMWMMMMMMMIWFDFGLQSGFAVDIHVVGAGHHRHNERHLQVPASQSVPSRQSGFSLHHATGLRHHVRRGNSQQQLKAIEMFGQSNCQRCLLLLVPRGWGDGRGMEGVQGHHGGPCVKRQHFCILIVPSSC